MTEDQTMGLVLALGSLVLVGSALVARRLPAGQTLKLGLIWLAIFAGAFALIRLFGLEQYFT